jgi:hypothetical protein
MPQGGRTGRAMAKSQGAFVTPIVTNNPVFQVKVLGMDDRMEQSAGQQEPMKDEIRRGEAVVGIAIGGGKEKKKHKGLVENIIKDSNGNVTSVVITDEDGDKLKLDPTSIKRLDLHDEGKNSTAGEDFKIAEDSVYRAKTFDDWKLNESMVSSDERKWIKFLKNAAKQPANDPKSFVKDAWDEGYPEIAIVDALISNGGHNKDDAETYYFNVVGQYESVNESNTEDANKELQVYFAIQSLIEMASDGSKGHLKKLSLLFNNATGEIQRKINQQSDFQDGWTKEQYNAMYDKADVIAKSMYSKIK